MIIYKTSKILFLVYYLFDGTVLADIYKHEINTVGGHMVSKLCDCT